VHAAAMSIPQSWIFVARGGGFALWHRPGDSNVYCDNFTIMRGNDRWRIGWDGSEIVNNADDEILRSRFPKMRVWALACIERFVFQRAQNYARPQ
jgi:hypothetical protein